MDEPNSCLNEEVERKNQRYHELEKLVIKLIEDCKIDKPDDKFIFDKFAFKAFDEIEFNWALKERRQFDILLVDKNRDAIAICYHPAISAEDPVPVDLKRFNLHHCIQLLFMPDDTYRTRPDDSDGRYYYQFCDFRSMLFNQIKDEMRKIRDAEKRTEDPYSEKLKKAFNYEKCKELYWGLINKGISARYAELKTLEMFEFCKQTMNLGRNELTELRDIVCHESESLDDAFTYEKCKELYLRIITDGVKESIAIGGEPGQCDVVSWRCIAKQEALKLFNEAQWLACQEILDLTWVTSKFDDIATSDYFSEEDVRALANKILWGVRRRLRGAGKPTGYYLRASVPVKYKSYDKWGEHCQFTPFYVTKRCTDDLLVKLLYASTDTEEGRKKLLDDITKECDYKRYEQDREWLWHWVVTKYKNLQQSNKETGIPASENTTTNHTKADEREVKSKSTPKTKTEIFEELKNKYREHFNDKMQKLEHYLNLFVEAGDIQYIKDKDYYAVCNKNIKQQNIAFWLKRVFLDEFYLQSSGGVPWSIVESLIRDKKHNVFKSLKGIWSQNKSKWGEKTDKNMLDDLLKNSKNARIEKDLFRPLEK